LVCALECSAPLAGASRHRLRDVDEVRLVRGEREHSRTSEAGRSLLTLGVPDSKLSSRHACIRRETSVWVLEDLNSTNGSYVDGRRIARHELRHGDVLELGSTVFLFHELAASRGIPADLSLIPGERGPLTTLNPALEEVFTRFTRMAGSELPVLLLGETGTGKDLLARAIHDASGRSGRFVAVNCGAIPGTLLEAQLFGYTKGAFTGAVKDELGFVRAASFGTLFLDEIGDLATASQAALLRVLQSGEVTPVGSAQSIHADVRVVAATHQNLEQLMESGVFRHDLYARLAGFVNRVPPLRERREDLGLLVGTLLARNAANAGHVRIRLDAARALFRHAWPLNVRELSQCLAAALVLSHDGVIALSHLPDSIRHAIGNLPVPLSGPSRSSQPPLSAEDESIHAALLTALQETEGNVSETARRLGKARQQVQRWLRRFAIDPTQFKKTE
jgi:DNA-binding NtrC family response regulator